MAKSDFMREPKWQAQRIAAVDLRAMDLFWPQSTGGGFTGPMRLVALLMLVFDQHGEGETYWDHDQIADRTGLSVSQVQIALEQLRQVNLVKETTAGPVLTWATWKERTRPAWLKQGFMRPTPRSVSAQQSNKENGNGTGQVAARAEGDIAGQGAGDGTGGTEDGGHGHRGGHREGSGHDADRGHVQVGSAGHDSAGAG